MPFIPAWVIIASGLRRTAGLIMSNVSPVIYPEKHFDILISHIHLNLLPLDCQKS